MVDPRGYGVGFLIGGRPIQFAWARHIRAFGRKPRDQGNWSEADIEFSRLTALEARRRAPLLICWLLIEVVKIYVNHSIMPRFSHLIIDLTEARNARVSNL
ncbi:hypothetical protein SAMN05444004_12053 [Jannaschia faecimaris]|uniref:Uncharacterized protein n=1 Tax=Jannaschia faecimaris TaxID=1244108 RepID=A0A1H3U000_9RHOB|nr:hypothetical protein SAMN05444004_12053 [Jannaschia faecimaris]